MRGHTSEERAGGRRGVGARRRPDAERHRDLVPKKLGSAFAAQHTYGAQGLDAPARRSAVPRARVVVGLPSATILFQSWIGFALKIGISLTRIGHSAVHGPVRPRESVLSIAPSRSRAHFSPRVAPGAGTR